MSVVTEHVYLGTSGSNDIQLQDDSASGVMTNADSSGWTRVVISNGVFTVDSSVDLDAITWNSTGKLTLTLGSVDIQPGVYRNCNIKVYSVNYQDGVVYGGGDNSMTIKVV